MKVYAGIAVILLILVVLGGYDQFASHPLGMTPMLPYLGMLCIISALVAWLHFVLQRSGHRRRSLLWLALGVSSLNALTLTAFFVFTTLTLTSNAHAESKAQPALKVLTANLWNDPSAIGPFIKLLNTQNPDIVFLQESYEPWRSAILAAFPDHHYVSECPHPQNCDAAILSRFPILEVNEDVCNGCAVARIDLTSIGGNEPGMLAVSVHLSRANSEHSEKQVAALANLMQNWSGKVILAGDFNMTPWDSRMRDMSRRIGLALYSGFAPTWPTPSRVGADSVDSIWIPGVSIDHVFASSDLSRQGAVARHDFGSDHYAVVLELDTRD